MHLRYTNGTVMIRRSLLDGIDHRSRGFFFQTEVLVRAIRRGGSFAEVSCRLGQRRTGASKALSWRSLTRVTLDYLILVKSLFFQRRSRP